MVKAGRRRRRAWVRQPKLPDIHKPHGAVNPPRCCGFTLCSAREEPCAIAKGEEYYAVLVDIQIFEMKSFPVLLLLNLVP